MENSLALLVNGGRPIKNYYFTEERYHFISIILMCIGVSAGIDLAFYYVKIKLGADEARKTAEMMEYDWKDMDVTPCICVFA